MADKIGDWTSAQLRQFVVNQILTDPGALPKTEPTPLGAGFPTTVTDQDVPMWDKASQTWKTNRTVRFPQDVSYIVMQGAPIGFIADTNFRLYNLGSLSLVVEQDSQDRVAMNASGYLQIKTPGNYLLGFSAYGPASGFECGICLSYNGSAIDSTAQNGSNWGGLGAVQPMGVSGLTMTNFFASSTGLVQFSGFSTAAISLVRMWAMWLPA